MLTFFFPLKKTKKNIQLARHHQVRRLPDGLLLLGDRRRPQGARRGLAHPLRPRSVDLPRRVRRAPGRAAAAAAGQAGPGARHPPRERARLPRQRRAELLRDDRPAWLDGVVRSLEAREGLRRVRGDALGAQRVFAAAVRGAVGKGEKRFILFFFFLLFFISTFRSRSRDDRGVRAKKKGGRETRKS